MRFLSFVALVIALFVCLIAGNAISAVDPAGEKPPLAFDEFFDSVSFDGVSISPDGNSVVLVTQHPDWETNRFRTDLWLYRAGDPPGTLAPLTQSGHDHSPQWSPDGKWIAFLSDRVAATNEKSAEEEDKAEACKSEDPDQVYVISAAGGEAFPVTQGEDSVHAFAWSGDSRAIYFAARIELSDAEKEAHKKEWRDVWRFRESERGDAIWRVDVAEVLNERAAGKFVSDLKAQTTEAGKISERAVALATSPDGKRLALFTEPRSERDESLDEYAIYVIDLDGHGAPSAPRAVSRAQAVYESMRWARDSRHIFFGFYSGAIDGKYQDTQPRVYWVDAGAPAENGTNAAAPITSRWAAKFDGAVNGYTVLSDGSLFVAGREGTEVQPYTQNSPDGDFAKRSAWTGTYEQLSAAMNSPRVAFVYSSLAKPSEVYIADSVGGIAGARAITSFNRVFTERALPQGKPYRWTADDGSPVEGMLIYPPGKMGEKNLKMFTLIHGGPEDADGNYFEADWYQWASLAATNGWLVFEPNYRGSTGYGDAFALGIIPHIVSRPGKDILEGIDALVKDGIADPNHLTVGGYSYGGYMTNWLITQTTRFKAAVTGAGAVEHVANWGNDDTTMDDAYFLGGLPWEAEANYNAEAAIWQFGKVTTPTHVVGGADDIRVYVGEDYLLERALHTRGIPSSLLIFPGECHSLEKNPWDGKIKVREELKWLEKYGMQ